MYFKTVTIKIGSNEYSVSIPCSPSTPESAIMKSAYKEVMELLETQEKEQTEQFLSKKLGVKVVLNY